ncbi:MAG: hypothetical protein QM642_11100, partial [Edaphocola sp.]
NNSFLSPYTPHCHAEGIYTSHRVKMCNRVSLFPCTTFKKKSFLFPLFFAWLFQQREIVGIHSSISKMSSQIPWCLGAIFIAQNYPVCSIILHRAGNFKQAPK